MTAELRRTMRLRARTRRLLPHLFWLALAVALLYLTLRAVDLMEVWDRLRHLEPSQIALLLAVNLLVLATFSLRWWLLLFAQGYRIPYLLLMSYRLATFAVSYFTPGPHFGGEPLQVYLVSARHAVPVSASVAAVVVDKVLEMAANFTFLVLGVLFIMRSQPALSTGQPLLLITSLFLLTIPVGVLVGLFLGWRPLSVLLVVADRPVRRLAALLGRSIPPLPETAFYRSVRQSEEQSTDLCRNHPVFLTLAIGASALSWVAIAGEFWLMTSVLGLNLTLADALVALLAARLAILLPLPAAVGALEASQALAMRLLGQSPAAGVTLSLLIRGRDVFLGLLGLALAWMYVWGRKQQPALVRQRATVEQGDRVTMGQEGCESKESADTVSLEPELSVASSD